MNDIPPDPPHPTQAWRVEAVREGKTQPNKKGPGNLTSYYVDFEGCEDGWCPGDGTFWRRREGDAPNVGETVHGTISAGQYGYSFRLTPKDQTPSQPRTPDFKAAAGSPTGETQDARQKSIVRQSSQKQAIEFLKAVVADGSNRAPSQIEFTPEWLDLHLLPIVDFFEADASGQARPSAPSGASDDNSIPFARPNYPDLFSGPEKGAHAR